VGQQVGVGGGGATVEWRLDLRRGDMEIEALADLEANPLQPVDDRVIKWSGRIVLRKRSEAAERQKCRGQGCRSMPSFLMREYRVLGCSPKRSAACPAPLMRHWQASRTARIWARSISSSC